MNKIHKALFSLFGFFVGHEAYAAVACSLASEAAVSTLNTTTVRPSAGTADCASTSTTYYYANSAGTTFFKVIQCTSCSTGWQRLSEKVPALPCSFTVQYCKECEGCTNCTSDTSWSTATNGLQSKTTARCTDICNQTCERTTAYRCIGGYYGSPTDTNPVCYVCPTSGGLEGTSTLGDNSMIEKCYFPAGRSVDDTTGTYQFTDKCFYSS
ncbi:MAG: hypothetical protein IKL37_02640 [Alphaproteobacteria bacterium]|nr:hypothetical protein [Alphaproteobacteria bacterium]